LGIDNQCDCNVCTKQREFRGYYTKRVAEDAASKTRSAKKFKADPGRRLGGE